MEESNPIKIEWDESKISDLKNWMDNMGIDCPKILAKLKSFSFIPARMGAILGNCCIITKQDRENLNDLFVFVTTIVRYNFKLVDELFSKNLSFSRLQVSNTLDAACNSLCIKKKGIFKKMGYEKNFLDNCTEDELFIFLDDFGEYLIKQLKTAEKLFDVDLSFEIE